MIQNRNKQNQPKAKLKLKSLISSFTFQVNIQLYLAMRTFVVSDLSEHPEWELEKTINSDNFSKWLSNNMSVGLYLSIFYVLAVFGGQKYMENKERLVLIFS